MFTHYRHTQLGTVTLTALVAFFLLMFVILRPAEFPQTALVITLVFVSVLAMLFSSLTIQIEQGALQWRFGVGLFGGSIPLAEVRDVSIVRNPWYYGWGIRFTPHGWLYNVSGLDAVEVKLKSGRRFRLGTDEPHALIAALQEAAPGR